MSGGSYNYIYWKIDFEKFDYDFINNAEKMVNRLVELGYEDAASELKELELIIKQSRVRTNTILRRLKGVMKAVEYYDSGDYSIEQIEEAIDDYRND